MTSETFSASSMQKYLKTGKYHIAHPTTNIQPATQHTTVPTARINNPTYTLTLVVHELHGVGSQEGSQLVEVGDPRFTQLHAIAEVQALNVVLHVAAQRRPVVLACVCMCLCGSSKRKEGRRVLDILEKNSIIFSRNHINLDKFDI